MDVPLLQRQYTSAELVEPFATTLERSAKHAARSPRIHQLVLSYGIVQHRLNKARSPANERLLRQLHRSILLELDAIGVARCAFDTCPPPGHLRFMVWAEEHMFQQCPEFKKDFKRDCKLARMSLSGM